MKSYITAHFLEKKSHPSEHEILHFDQEVDSIQSYLCGASFGAGVPQNAVRSKSISLFFAAGCSAHHRALLRVWTLKCFQRKMHPTCMGVCARCTSQVILVLFEFIIFPFTEFSYFVYRPIVPTFGLDSGATSKFTYTVNLRTGSQLRTILKK